MGQGGRETKAFCSANDTFQFVSAGTFKERLPAEQYSTEPTRGDVYRIAALRKTEFSLILWVEA